MIANPVPCGFAKCRRCRAKVAALLAGIEVPTDPEEQVKTDELIFDQWCSAKGISVSKISEELYAKIKRFVARLSPVRQA